MVRLAPATGVLRYGDIFIQSREEISAFFLIRVQVWRNKISIHDKQRVEYFTV